MPPATSPVIRPRLIDVSDVQQHHAQAAHLLTKNFTLGNRQWSTESNGSFVACTCPQQSSRMTTLYLINQYEIRE